MTKAMKHHSPTTSALLFVLLIFAIPCSAETVARVPYYPGIDNTILVQAWAQRRLPTIFQIDFGANINFISRSVVGRLKLVEREGRNSDGSVVFDALTGKPVRYVDMKEFQVGTLLVNLTFAVEDDQRMPACGLAFCTSGHTDGIISANILNAFATQIDFQQHLLTICLHTTLSDDEIAKLGMADAPYIDLSLTKGVTTVPVILHGNTFTVTHSIMVDTGDGFSDVSNADARALGLQSRYTTTRYNSITGGVTYNYDVLASLQLGDTPPIRNQAVYYLDHDARGDVPPHIGIDVLSHYVVLFDLGRKRLYLSPVKKAPTTPPHLPPASAGTGA